jgi:hypothetical protein
MAGLPLIHRERLYRVLVTPPLLTVLEADHSPAPDWQDDESLVAAVLDLVPTVEARLAADGQGIEAELLELARAESFRDPLGD